MQFTNRESVPAPAPDHITALVCEWVIQRARAKLLWAESDALAARGEEVTEGQSVELAEQASRSLAEADRVVAQLARQVPQTVEHAMQLQDIALDVLHHRHRAADITDALASGPIIPILENVRLGLQVISGQMTFEDAHDAALTRRADTGI